MPTHRGTRRDFGQHFGGRSEAEIMQQDRDLLPILRGIVLNTRPQKVGKAYEAIWNKDLDESYLRTYTRSQAEKLAVAEKHIQFTPANWPLSRPA